MKKHALPLLLLALVLLGAHASEPVDAEDGTSGVLYDTIVALDDKVFDTYNRCALSNFEGHFVPDVEFYHDKGGVTWTRQEVVDGTRSTSAASMQQVKARKVSSNSPYRKLAGKALWMAVAAIAACPVATAIWFKALTTSPIA